MKEVADGLRQIKATTLTLLEVLLKWGIVTKAQVARELGVSRPKVDGLIGKPGANNMQDNLEIGQVAKLLEIFSPLLDEETLTEHPRVKTLHDTLAQSVVQQDEASFFGLEFEAFEKNAVRPEADMQLGTWLLSGISSCANF